MLIFGVKNRQNIITVYDYHRNKYQVNKASLEFDVHVYGIAVKDGKIQMKKQDIWLNQLN